MLKALKQMFQKKSASKEITVKINADTADLEKALSQVSEQVRETKGELERVFDNPHIRLVTNDDNVPELYIDGKKVDSIADIKYYWHTSTGDESRRYDINVTYCVGEFEHHEIIKDIEHAAMDRAAFDSILKVSNPSEEA